MNLDLNLDPDLDRAVERVIRAPREEVWRAWTEAEAFGRWWLPAPMTCRVELFDVRPGGGFVTSMSEDGVGFVPHMDVCFLAVEEGERIVFTNAVDSTGRPAAPKPVALTAEFLFADHADGTLYTAIARHGDAAARAEHEALGLVEGWSFVSGQLAAVAEGRA